MQLRAMSQQYQMVMAQSQRLAMDDKEIGISLTEVESATGKVFMSTGAVLIEESKESVLSKLKEQKKQISDKLDVLKVQEDRFKKKVTELQKGLQESQK